MPPISQMQGPQRVRLQLSCPARKSDSETISFLIKQSKTDQMKKGHFVYIFNISSPIQPYQAVREYLRLRISQAKSPLEPLFLDHAGNSVSRTWFQKQLKSILLSAGISATNFSSHSFRIGAATSAAQKGLTKHQIQTLGRWSSEAGDGRRREHSRPDNLIFSSPRSTRLTRPTQHFWNHSRMSARASQPDNLTFPSPKLGKAYPSDTAIAEATVGRRREPPRQTILPFKVPCSARLTRPTRQLLKPLSDVGMSLPARQTHPFRYVPGRSGNLSFQSTTGEVQPSDSRVLISCRMPQEPPGWTTSPFPPTSAKLTHQTGGHAHQLDDG